MPEKALILVVDKDMSGEVTALGAKETDDSCLEVLDTLSTSVDDTAAMGQGGGAKNNYEVDLLDREALRVVGGDAKPGLFKSAEMCRNVNMSTANTTITSMVDTVSGEARVVMGEGTESEVVNRDSQNMPEISSKVMVGVGEEAESIPVQCSPGQSTWITLPSQLSLSSPTRWDTLSGEAMGESGMVKMVSLNMPGDSSKVVMGEEVKPK